MQQAIESLTAPTRVRVCQVDDVPLGLGRAFHVAGVDIAVFRSRAGTLHALKNRCPHRGGPLAEGMLAGNRVVCPFHAYRFDLNSGECDQQHLCGVDVFPVEVSDSWVLVTVPTHSGDRTTTA